MVACTSQELTQQNGQNKVLFILGSTATGKSKLAIKLALKFDGEIINSDKMQVYKGLNIITNKVTPEESLGIRHHLLSVIQPIADFTKSDFRRAAIEAVDEILARGHLPIIAGGSNSYIKELVEGNGGEFIALYDCCFIWVDIELEVLNEVIAERVDSMVEKGLVEEVRGLFNESNWDYTKGIWRAIGAMEMDSYLRGKAKVGGEERVKLRAEAIEEIKKNTWKLARAQRGKIAALIRDDGWRVWRVDATKAVKNSEQLWEEIVWEPSVTIVNEFLENLMESMIGLFPYK